MIFADRYNLNIIRHMKNKWLIITAIAFFLIISTNNFWEGLLGLLALPVFLLLGIFYLILLINFIRHFVFASKEKFADKHRVLILCFLLFVLSIVAIKPYGMINFDNLQGKDVLIAQQEAVANCTTTIKLNEGGRFVIRDICFGVTDIRGKYTIKNDTIYFDYGKTKRRRGSYYAFAVPQDLNVTSDKYIGTLMMFSDKTDTVGYPLRIIKYEIKKRPIAPSKPQQDQASQ